jgi:hypothetical protein
MEKIKQFIESEKGKDIMIVIIIILVGLGSFELGRLSKTSKSSGIKIEYPNNEKGVLGANVITSMPDAKLSTAQSSEKNFFASSRGSKYYSITCSAGKTIKQENRVYFDTREEAERAGYTLSSSCK